MINYITEMEITGMTDKKRPRCKMFPPCRAEDRGRCTALRDNNFKGKTCPFYKKRVTIDGGKGVFTDDW